MAECHEVLNLIAKEDTYANLYVDIVKQTTDILDAYFWIANPEAENLAEPLPAIREAAQAAISEFEKVDRDSQEHGRTNSKPPRGGPARSFRRSRVARFDDDRATL